MKQKPWYHKGLCFECTQCGDCCSGASGLVVFEPEEGQAMAERLKVSYEEFLERYAVLTDDGWSLKEVPAPNGTDLDCILLQRDPESGKTSCSVHQARPTQCRTWPFWPGNLRSPRSWHRAARECEGIDCGPRVPLQEIEQQRRATPSILGVR
ncbi:MAG: YkgJ family cysteine cluster protein [Candidatus Eremiobacteraeota bacterium]|nr:YkgJ family cysteine cluster protein [Candidatus Eremiobacteraeota bacterium]